MSETISLLNQSEPTTSAPDDGAPLPDITALTGRISRGDEPAWREFYDLYFNRLLRYLLVVTGGREDAAREALQLTMLRVVKHVRKFESAEAFWSWLTVLARSAAVDEQRKRTRYLAVLDRFFRREPGMPGAGTHDADTRLSELLEHEMANLPDHDKTLIERKYFGGCSVKHLAHELQTSEKAIESRLVRVRKRLKDAVLAQLNHERAD